MRRLDVPPEKEAVEKIVARGEFPLLHFDGEKQFGRPCICFREQEGGKPGLLRLNSYYAVVEAGLEDIVAALGEISSAASESTRIWLCPAEKGYRLRILSPSPSSDELASVIPFLRRLVSKGRARIVRPLSELDSYPDNRGCRDIRGRWLVILGSGIIADLLDRIGPRDMASILLSRWKPTSYEDIIRLIEETGIAKISKVLTVKANARPVGSIVRASNSSEEVKPHRTAELIGEITLQYISAKYSVELEYKVNKASSGEIEVFVYRRDAF